MSQESVAGDERGGYRAPRSRRILDADLARKSTPEVEVPRSLIAEAKSHGRTYRGLRLWGVRRATGGRRGPSTPGGGGAIRGGEQIEVFREKPGLPYRIVGTWEGVDAIADDLAGAGACPLSITAPRPSCGDCLPH